MDGFLVVKNRLIFEKFCLVASCLIDIIAHGILQYKTGDFWTISACFGAGGGILTCFFCHKRVFGGFCGYSFGKNGQ